METPIGGARFSTVCAGARLTARPHQGRYLLRGGVEAGAVLLLLLLSEYCTPAD